MNIERLQQTVRKYDARYDERARAWLHRYTARGGRVFCGAGCYRCCDMPIRISWAEAVTIGAAMTEAQHVAVAAHARKVWKNARLTKDPDQYAENHRKHVGFCPLLDRATGTCTQYEVRPIRCRDTHSALPAEFCAPDGLTRLTPKEYRAYEREVKANPVTDGHTHFIAPLEEMSMPAWNAFSEVMRREMGFELWGDFHYLVSMTRDPDFVAALELRDPRRVKAALRQAGRWHDEILQVE